MADINHGSNAPVSNGADALEASVPGATAEASSHWMALLTQVGSEIARPLTAAMERINTLATTGKIDRRGLRALREEVEAARRAGMVGQQLARFASGRIRQSHERLNLTQMLRDQLAQHGRDLQARGIAVRQTMKPAEVIADASLLFGLLNSLLDWCAEHACMSADFRIDHQTWPVQARLHCRFAYRMADDLMAGMPTPDLDTLSWRLVEQMAWTMGLEIEREESGIETQVRLQFPRTVNREMEGVSAIEVDEGFPSTLNSKPLAGSHVLVLASRRELRLQVREAIGHMGLVLDFVTSVDELREFCSGGLPHAIVYESVLSGERLDQLRHDIQADLPTFVFIEIVEQGDVFQMSNFEGLSLARVGRDVLHSALPSALVFELSKNL